MKHTSIRVVLAMVAHDNMELEHMDVKTTFFHGDLEETIYMHTRGSEHLLCELKKVTIWIEAISKAAVQEF